MVGTKKSHYQDLKEKWQTRHRKLQEKLWQKHGESLRVFADNAKKITAGGAASLLLLASPGAFSPISHQPDVTEKAGLDIDKSAFLITDLFSVLPKEVMPLNKEEEQKVIAIISRDFGIKVTAEIAGKRLSRNYGIIGAEQHLARYPGDTIYSHFDSEEEARKFYSAGMAPGLGAWSYFAPSQSQLTAEDKLRERYYIAVQTFLADNFNQKFIEYRDFFKYRKMLVVNPQNGKAISAVIGDAGPATWTGKDLGGSPEIMDYLEREDGEKAGPALYFFIDDPDSKVPLGPIKL